MAAITTPELAAELLASPMSPAELAELAAAETSISEAWLGMGKALCDLRYGLEAHRDQRTTRGRPIPTEAGRWRAYQVQLARQAARLEVT